MRLSLPYFLCAPQRPADFPWRFSWNTPQWRSVWEQQAAAAWEVFRGRSAGSERIQVSQKSHCVTGALCASWQVLGEANIPLFSWGKQTNQMWEALRMTVEQKPGDVPHQLPVRDSIAGRCWGFQPWAGSSCCCSVFPLPVCWYSVADASGTRCRPAAAFYFIFCQGMQSVFIRPIFGAGDPSS